MRALFVSSEVYPLAKSGGLADVSHALPAALKALRVDLRLLMPGYPQAIECADARAPKIRLGSVLGFDDVALIPARVPESDLPVWLVDCPALFDRGGRLYGDDEGRDWPDNHLRFAMLSQIGAGFATGRLPVGWQPDIVHANDWHTGLLPLLARAAATASAPTLFTIHNMAFQGIFGTDAGGRIGLAAEQLGPDGLEYYGNISFLKAGIRYADKLTTVSETYAKEIMKPEFGLGFEGLLATRADDLTGILNGVDYGTWDPATDMMIPCRYSVDDMAGKRVSKAALQSSLGLEVEPDTPLVAYMSRLTGQKMADCVLSAAPELADRLGQVVVLAEGERCYEEDFLALARHYAGRMSVQIGYTEASAHRLLAGADILLSPARFEPCGLTHLYAMRYGTLPVVCRTGGLADTVVDADRATIADRTATGFHADGFSAVELLAAAERAVRLYRQPLVRRRMRETAMAQDFSWNRSAREYLRLYRCMARAGDETPPMAAAARDAVEQLIA